VLGTPEPGFLERKPMSTNESDDHESIDNRTERALTEYMTVLDEGGDIYTVVGENENGAYQVDARKGRCTCPDHEHRNARCKHLRRVAFARGEEAIPSEVDDVDPQLGDHVGGEPITAEARADEGAVATDGGIIEAGDDGEILDDENDDRPDDCQCLDEYTDDDPLACWACYREGFDEPNPNGGDDSDSRPKPTRSEPADFGGGETTGVQDL
jgi:hypothetical protein